MSKLTNELREVRIINPHSFYVEKGQVFIQYCPATTGRGSRSAYWQVFRIGYKTDPDGHFMNYGNKTFSVWGGGHSTHAQMKAAKLEEAKAWAEEKYGKQEWHRDPFGSYGEITYVKARLKALKAKLKRLPYRVGDTVLVNGEGEPRIVNGIYSEDRTTLEGDPRGYRAIYYKASELTKVA